jgi:predicted RNase H-like HicB family nuclease
MRLARAYSCRGTGFEPALCGRAIIRHMSETVRLTVRFEDAGEGWVMATIPEVPGAISQGRDRDEARENVIDALRVVLTPDEQLAGADLGENAEPLELTIA